jgi:5-methylthioadenosine/S-adenosylhomocysteine deaminase
MENIDLLIHAKWIITCEETNRMLTDHALAVKDGKIIAILPQQEAKNRFQATNIEQFETHAILPGFINAHTHIAMNVFRGIADDLELMDWLTNHIWPAEKKWVSEALVSDASELAIAEMIRSGTTCFNDMYFFLQATAKVAERAGLRTHIGITIIDFPTEWAKNVDEYFAKGIAFYEEYKNHPRITATMAPQGTYTVKEKDLIRIKQVAEQYQLRTNIHCQETLSDIEGAIKLNGKRPLRLLNDIGLVSPQLITIHMTQLDAHDFEILQAKGAHVVHCPESNMKLASGICPVEKLTKLGVNVALGTDGAASNNDLDMISEMRTAAFLAKLSTEDAKALPAEKALQMATLNGAKALGIDHLTGSLTIGKAADFIAIDLDRIETQPVYDPAAQIVYASSRDQVTDVWVGGKQLLKNRKLLTLDEKAILEKAKNWRKKIKS